MPLPELPAAGLYDSAETVQHFVAAESAAHRTYLKRFPFDNDLTIVRTQFLQLPNTDTALQDPMFGAWVDDLSEAVQQLGPYPEIPEHLRQRIRAAQYYLGNFALSAAIAGNYSLNTVTRGYDGYIMVPGVGRFAYPDNLAYASTDTSGVVTLKSREGAVTTFDPHDTAQPGWEPLRYVGPDDFRIPLNDIEPNRRHLFRYPVSERLSDDQYRQWHDAFMRSWDFIQEAEPHLARLMRAGLRTLVPAPTEPLTHGKSMVAGGTFGVISPNEIRDPIRFASQMTFGLRKNMLLALRLLHPDVHRDDSDPIMDKPVFAPSREGYARVPFLLDDSFIDTGWARFYDTIAQTCDARLLPYVQFSYLHWFNESRQNLDALEASGYITPQNRPLAQAMRTELTEVSARAETIPPHIKELFARFTTDKLVSWRLHNIIPEPNAITYLRDAWLRGEACPFITIANTLNQSTEAYTHIGERMRYVLTEISLKEPTFFAAVARGDVPHDVLGHPTPGDIHHAQGDIRAARAYYRSAIAAQESYHPEVWAGFALSFHADPHRGNRTFTEQPEVIAALHAAIGDARLEPERIAQWLAGRAVSSIPPDCSRLT